MNDSAEHIPDFAALAADPEIAPLLDFEPVPRKIDVPGGWSPDKQREVIARLAVHGSPNRACDEMGMHRTGLTKLYKSPRAKSFRAAWESAVALAARRRAERAKAQFVRPGATPPTVDWRRKHPVVQDGPLPGQVLNEYGEWEDEGSLMRRVEEAKDSIGAKLLNCRRLYLREISSSPGKRAAFEILTELPIDWDKAARLEPQPDEPWNRANMRQPDMVLTAESGWSAGELGYGPDKKAELRAEIDKYREEEGLPPVDWSEDDATPPSSSPTPIGDPPSSSPPSPTSPMRPGPRLRRI